jgi:copper chaperone CopZ
MIENNSKDRSTTILIGGMTCASCELLLERKLKAMPGVQSVDVDYKTGIGCVATKQGNAPSLESISEVVEKAGYTVLQGDALYSSLPADKRKWVEIGASVLIIFALYKLLQTFDVVSLAPSTSGALSFGADHGVDLVDEDDDAALVGGHLL